MADAEEIIQRIGVSGTEEIGAALTEVGRQGEQAFAKMAEHLGVVGEAFAGLVVGITGVVTALGAWAIASANTAVEVSHLADQSAMSVESMSAMEGAMAEMGVNTDKLGMAFRRLSVLIENEWSKIVKEAAHEANELAQSQLNVAKANLSVEQAHNRLSEAFQKYRQLGQGVRSTHLQMAEAATRVREAQLGIAEATLQASEAIQKASEAQRNSISAVAKAVDEVARGVKTLAEAGKDANLSLENILKGVIADAGPAADHIKSLSGNLSELASQAPTVKDAFFKMEDVMKNSGNAALNTALVFKFFGRGIGQDMVQFMSLGSEATKELMHHIEELGFVTTQLQVKMGKDLRKEVFALKEELGQLQTKLGSLFQPAMLEGFEMLRKFVEVNRKEIMALGLEIATRVRPIILDFFRILTGQQPKTQWVATVVGAFKELATFVKNSVIPVFMDLFRIMNNEAPKTEWMNKFIIGLTQLRDAVKSWATIIMGALDGITDRVNKAFGTNWSTGALVVIYAIARISGALKILGSLLLLFPGYIAGAFVIGAGIYLFWDDIVKLANQAWDRIKRGAKDVRDQIAKDLGTELANDIVAGFVGVLVAGLSALGVRIAAALVISFGAALLGLPAALAVTIAAVGAAIGFAIGAAIIVTWDGVKAQVSAFLDWIKSSFQALISWIKSLFAFTAQSSGPGTPTGFASGGAVPGSGHGDSVPAMLTPGEYVVTKSGSNLGDAFAHFARGFSLGGLVDAMTPRVQKFAAGGPVLSVAGGSSGRPLVLDFGSGGKFGGMTASDGAVSQLTRFAAARSISSSGRKPGWFG